MADLQKLKVFERVFSSKDFHLQVVQRSEDLLQIYASEEQLTDEHIDMLWAASLTEETAKLEIFKLIGETAKSMSDRVVDAFIQKVQDLQPEAVTMKDVDLVYNLGKSSTTRALARRTAQ